LTAYNGAGESEFNVNANGGESEAKVTFDATGNPVVIPGGGLIAGLKDAYVYPNPAAGKDPIIHAELGDVESAEVTIFNSAGRLVKSEAVAVTAGAAGGYAWTEAKASGTYYAVIHGKTAAGKTVRARAKFAVMR
jgi:hypothetical protein